MIEYSLTRLSLFWALAWDPLNQKKAKQRGKGNAARRERGRERERERLRKANDLI
jgi:hypothetical protein